MPLSGLLLLLACLHAPPLKKLVLRRMIFIGFGFLYCFMREYSFSGLGFNLLLACQCIELATITDWCVPPMCCVTLSFLLLVLAPPAASCTGDLSLGLRYLVDSKSSLISRCLMHS